MTALNNQLDLLESAELIRLACAQPQLEYLFRHALVQDAAYHTLVRQDRRHIHQQVAETLERMYPDRLDELAPVLAQHFYGADDHAYAYKYFVRAGELAARKYANAESIMHYSRALDIAQHDADMHRAAPLLDLYSA